MSCPDWKELVSQRDLLDAPRRRRLDAPRGRAAARRGGKLAALRGRKLEAPPASEAPAENWSECWSDAVRHLDSGCTRCRREALAADPSLVFRRLPAAAPPAPAGTVGAMAGMASMAGTSASSRPTESESDEIASVRRVVAAMRTRSELEVVKRGPRSSLRRIRRWVAAATLAGAALSTGSSQLAQSGFGGLAGPSFRMSRLAGASDAARDESGLPLRVRRVEHVENSALAAVGAGAAAALAGPAGQPVNPAEDLSPPNSRVYDFPDRQFRVTMFVNAKFDV